MKNSGIKETRICDVCGCEYTSTHQILERTKDRFGFDVCPICAKTNDKCLEIVSNKYKASINEKYGCDNPSQNKTIKEKIANTNYSRYGGPAPACDKKVQEKIANTNYKKYGGVAPICSEEVRNKMESTNIEKYGCSNAMQNKEIKKRNEETIFKIYGVKNVFQSEETKEKIYTTNLKKYGTKIPAQNKEIQEKIRKTLYENENVPTSSQQIAIFNMLKESYSDTICKLNYPESSLSLDIALFFDDEIKIDVEYDGNYWHQDKVKDIKRDEYLKSINYKILRIKSDNKIPEKEDLLKCIESFKNDNHRYKEMRI